MKVGDKVINVGKKSAYKGLIGIIDKVIDKQYNAISQPLYRVTYKGEHNKGTHPPHVLQKILVELDEELFTL